MQQTEIESFEQASPIRKVSVLHRLNPNALSGPVSEFGISRGMLPFMMEVLTHEGIIQEDITQNLSIDRAATARVLQHMETDGLVVRKEDPKDRRRKHVYATPKAHELQDSLMDVLHQHKDSLFSGFDEKEQLQFLDMLDRMIANMREAVAG